MFSLNDFKTFFRILKYYYFNHQHLNIFFILFFCFIIAILSFFAVFNQAKERENYINNQLEIYNKENSFINFSSDFCYNKNVSIKKSTVNFYLLKNEYNFYYKDNVSKKNLINIFGELNNKKYSKKNVEIFFDNKNKEIAVNFSKEINNTKRKEIAETINNYQYYKGCFVNKIDGDYYFQLKIERQNRSLNPIYFFLIIPYSLVGIGGVYLHFKRRNGELEPFINTKSYPLINMWVVFFALLIPYLITVVFCLLVYDYFELIQFNFVVFFAMFLFMPISLAIFFNWGILTTVLFHHYIGRTIAKWVLFPAAFVLFFWSRSFIVLLLNGDFENSIHLISFIWTILSIIIFFILQKLIVFRINYNYEGLRKV